MDELKSEVWIPVKKAKSRKLDINAVELLETMLEILRSKLPTASISV